MPHNLSKILPRLYQGGAPPVSPTLASRGIDVLVLCAHEWQPPDGTYAGTELVRCPLNDRFDVDVSGTIARRAQLSASIVVRRLRQGKRVYVSCFLGINRSGLVTALAVRELLGVTGAEATRWVQDHRPGALSNPAFRAYLASLPLYDTKPEAIMGYSSVLAHLRA